MKHLEQRPFDVYAPGSKDNPPTLLKQIMVEVDVAYGEEFITQESRKEIERIRTRHMGLMSAADIKSLRDQFKLSQKELTDLLDCGDKTLSRWENGHGVPTGAANKLLRLLYEGFLSPSSLAAIHGPVPDTPWTPFVWEARSREPRRKPFRYPTENSQVETEGCVLV